MQAFVTVDWTKQRRHEPVVVPLYGRELLT